MKTFDIIIGIFEILLGLTMIVFAWYFFFEEDIIQLASLYVALFISVLISTMGVICITSKKEKQNNDK